jgi:hypothetical protein
MRAKSHLIALLIWVYYETIAAAFHHTRCSSRSVRADFQLDDCYLPPLSSNIPFSSASFVMSHNAATGYIQQTSLSKTGLSWFYTKNQVGTIYQQLQDGARALDIRPKLLRNGTVIMQHGSVNIPVTMERIVEGAIEWCRDNPEELVLILTSHFRYEQGSSSSDNTIMSMTQALANLYEQYNVTYISCQAVYGLTVANVMELAALSGGGGGYLLAMDAQDYYGTSCSKENWDPNNLVTCWSNDKRPCIHSNEPWNQLKSYMNQSVNNEPTNDKYSLGPPANLQYTPLNQVQAFWQVDRNAVTKGLLHTSSILQDNRRSAVNEKVVQFFYSGALQTVGLLLAVDNVALHGNALTSVLRTACGQSDDSKTCGSAIPLPSMHDWPLLVLLTLALVYLVALIVYIYNGRPKLLLSLYTRWKERFFPSDRDDSCQPVAHNRREALLADHGSKQTSSPLSS